MKKTEEIEFLNDVIYYAHPRGQVDFEWIIAPQLKTDDLKKRMLGKLGDNGKIDERLALYISDLNPDEQAFFRSRIEGLIRDIKSDKVIKGGSYVP